MTSNEFHQTIDNLIKEHNLHVKYDNQDNNLYDENDESCQYEFSVNYTDSKDYYTRFVIKGKKHIVFSFHVSTIEYSYRKIIKLLNTLLEV